MTCASGTWATIGRISSMLVSLETSPPWRAYISGAMAR